MPTETEDNEERPTIGVGDAVVMYSDGGLAVRGLVMDTGFSAAQREWLLLVQVTASDVPQVPVGQPITVQSASCTITAEHVSYNGGISTEWLGNPADLKL